MCSPRRLLLLSHCVLNQNAVVQPLARSGGVMRSAVDWALDQGYELYQLPCPEFRFAGPNRAPASFDDYNTIGFHASNAKLLEPVMRQLGAELAERPLIGEECGTNVRPGEHDQQVKLIRLRLSHQANEQFPTTNYVGDACSSRLLLR